MNVGPAWQKGYTGKGVVVSILDDGIQTNHPDLSQNYVSNSVLINYACLFVVSRSSVRPINIYELLRRSAKFPLNLPVFVLIFHSLYYIVYYAHV